MNSKERVLRAINHKEIDRVPFDLIGAPAEINKKLFQRLNIKIPDKLIYKHEELFGYFEVDVRRCDIGWNSSDAGYIGPPAIESEDTIENAIGGIYKASIDSTGQKTWSLVKPPLAEAKTADEILNYKRFFDIDWYNYTFPKEVYEKSNDYACVLYDAYMMFLNAMDFRGMENIMMDMAANPDMAHALFNKIGEFNLERLRRYLEANPGLFDIIGIGDDVAGQDGLFFSLDMWREYIKPHIQKAVDLCNEYKVIPYFHGCGGLSALFPDFIEMGVKIVGRFQTSAKGNNLERLKKDFGNDLCLWGGIDAQHICIEGSVEDVKEHVKAVINTGSKGSGFVASPTHQFTADTPVENIIAVYDTLKKENLK